MSTFPREDHRVSVCCGNALCMLPTVSLKILRRKASKGWDLIKLIMSTIMGIKWKWLFFFKTECMTRKNSMTTRMVWCHCFNLCQGSSNFTYHCFCTSNAIATRCTRQITSGILWTQSDTGTASAGHEELLKRHRPGNISPCFSKEKLTVTSFMPSCYLYGNREDSRAL